jgi:hypothetical protein
VAALPLIHGHARLAGLAGLARPPVGVPGHRAVAERVQAAAGGARGEVGPVAAGGGGGEETLEEGLLGAGGERVRGWLGGG